MTARSSGYSSVDIDEIAHWYFADRKRVLSDSEAVSAFHSIGARCRFLKTLPLNATVLDVGAGDGSLHLFRDWPPILRSDVRVYAYAGERGKNFDRYDGSEVGWWPRQPPSFDGMPFDAIMACHFIEHIDSPLEFVSWACDRLAPWGRIFLEWPSPQSVRLPTTAVLRARGMNIMVGNYFDDSTHRTEAPDMQRVVGKLQAVNMQITEYGIARVPFIDGEMLSAARAKNDIVDSTLAYWSFTGWCQYVTAQAIQ